MKQFKHSNTAGIPQSMSVIIGIVVSCIVSLLILAIGTTLISSGRVGENRYLLISAICWFIASFAGCSVSAILSKQNKIISVAITGVAYLLLLIGGQILFFEGGFHTLLIGILVITAGTIMTIYMFSDKRTKKKRKYSYHSK